MNEIEWRVRYRIDDTAPRGAGLYAGPGETERLARLRMADVRRGKSHVESWLERAEWVRVDEPADA